MKKIIFVLLCLFVFIGCQGEVDIEPVYLDDVILDINQEYEFEYSKEASITSSDPSVVSVEGLIITGLKAGESSLTIQDNTKTYYVNIIVLKNLREVKGKAEIDCLESITLEIIHVNEVSLKFTSSNTSIATVSEIGVVEGISEGSVTIKVTDELTGDFLEISIKVNKVEIIVDNKAAKELLDQYVQTIESEISTDFINVFETATLTFSGDNVSSTGVITREEFDKETTVTITLSLNNASASCEVDVLIWGTFTDLVVEEYMKQFGEKISTPLQIERKVNLYGGSSVTFKSSNTEIFSNSGMYVKPFHDTTITLSLNVTTTTPSVQQRPYEVEVIVAGEEISVKTAIVKEWIYTNFPKNSVLYEHTLLPTSEENVNSTITWYNSKGDLLDLSKVSVDPVLGDTVLLTARITVYGVSYDEVLSYRVWNKEFNSDLEKVEHFLNAINIKDVRSFIYKEAGNPTTNHGLLPFINNTKADINRDYLLEYTYGRVRTNIKKASTEYVVIHDTAGGYFGHTALHFAQAQETANKNKDNDYISWHFTIGDDGIYQSLPLDEVAYHAGDGSYVYGDVYYNNTYKAWSIGGGNRNGIGIETCVNQYADYRVTMQNLAKTVAELLIEFNLGFDRIKKHNDFSGKHCPAVLMDTQRWDDVVNMIKLEYFMKTELQDIIFTYTSLTPLHLTDTGLVINESGDPLNLSYKVSVAIGTVTKEYTYTSNVLERFSYL